MLSVNEIFHSIQGESTAAGRPCVFVRLQGCNLACRYCDTEDSRGAGGSEMEVAEIVRRVADFGCDLVEVTGGEPLVQPETGLLLGTLVEAGYEVLVESNGSLPLPENRGWRVIMDIKCPGSGMGDSFNRDNLARLTATDEVKFVIGDRRDFEWALARVEEYGLSDGRREVLLSPVPGACPPSLLAAWLLESGRRLRLQVQLHKIVWPEGEPKARGPDASLLALP